MGHRCCNKQKVKRGLWSPEEDERLVKHITSNGHGSWSSVPKLAGLQRCGKSCRLRWINYLRPDLKRGTFTAEEEQIIIDVHRILGNRWAQIAKHLPGRTDNEVKNFWNSCIKKKLISQGLDPKTHNLLSPHQRAALALEINKLNTTTSTDTTNHYNTSKPAVIFPTSNFSSSSPNSQYSEDLDQQPQVPISSLLTHTDTANLTSSSLDIPSPALAWNVDDDNNNNNNDSVLPISGINNIMNLPTSVSSHFPSGPSLNLLEDSYNSVTHHAESLFWEANNCGTLALDHQAFEAPKSMEVMEKEKVVDHVDNIHGDCEMAPIDEFGQDQQEDFDLAVVDPSLVYGAMYGDFVPMDDFAWNF